MRGHNDTISTVSMSYLLTTNVGTWYKEQILKWFTFKMYKIIKTVLWPWMGVSLEARHESINAPVISFNSVIMSMSPRKFWAWLVQCSHWNRASLIVTVQSTHWCSIWKLRWPENQSLKKDWSTLHVAFSCAVTQSSSWSRLMSMGMWFIWVVHTNQWLSRNLKIYISKMH